MADYYFGEDTIAGISNLSIGTNTYFNSNVAFPCPGSGTMDAVEIHAYCRDDYSPTNDDFRMAVCDTSRNLLFESSGMKAISSGYSWQGWIEALGTLTAGVNYVIAVTCNDGQSWVEFAYQGGSQGDFKRSTNEYTGGFPGTLPSGSSVSNNMLVRVGVDSQAAGGAALLRRPIDNYMRNLITR